MRYFWMFVLFCSLSCINLNVTWAQKPSVHAEVSSSTVNVEDIFRITFVINNPTGDVGIIKPNLADFILVGGPHQSSSRNIVVNGSKMTQEVSTNFTFVLKAKKAGTFQIKGGTVKVNGQSFQVAPITVKVLAGNNNRRSNSNPDDALDDFDRLQRQMQQQMRDLMRGFDEFEEPDNHPHPQQNNAELSIDKIDENIFLIAEVDKLHPYVGEQVNVTYKLYTRLGMNMRPMSMPQLNGFWAQDEEVSNPETPHQENYKGKRYNVFILRKSALFPQQSGSLTIDAVKAGGWVLVPQLTSGGFYRDQRVEKEISSAPVIVDVQALPPTNEQFKGAVGKFGISAQINQSTYTTDDLIQLTLAINGSGNLGLISAPEIDLPAGLSTIEPEIKDNFTEITPDFSGSRTFTYNISIEKPGIYTIPPIEFTYFDAADNQYKSLKTQAMTVNVTLGIGNNEISTAENKDLVKDIHNIITHTPSADNSSSFVLYKWYYWLTMLLACLSLLFLTKNRQRKANILDKYDDKAAGKVAAQRLSNATNALQAKDSNLFFVEISKAIWLYLSDRLQIPLKHLNKESLQKALHEKNIPEQFDKQTMSIIARCEMALYTPLGGQQQKETLAETYQLIESLEHLLNQKK